jgi:hypothetical protein
MKFAQRKFPRHKLCNANTQSRIIYSVFFPLSGGYIGGVTPVPIPNTEVKPS